MMRLLSCVLAGSLLLACASSGRHTTPHAGDEALERVIADTCEAQIVFLGEEGSHRVGRTFQVKTDIVRELVRRCGFTHVAFESQIYDFLDLQERYAAGTATRNALHDAIGGLWATAAEIDPLVDFLHENARSHRLTLSGFDGQIGSGMGYYTQTGLAPQLSSSLPAARQELCAAVIGRLTAWKFDRAHPKDKDFDQSVLGCAREVEAAAAADARRDPVQYRLARSFRSMLEFSPTESGSRTDRDRLMFENLEWTIARLPRQAKTIVWTATVHGLRKPLDGWEVMASHAVRDMKASIRSVAIIAIAGAYAAPNGGRVEIPVADADSLEAQFAPREGASQAYIDKESLQRAGTTRSRIVGYGRYIDGNWGEWLDGVLVLAAETPPTYVRPPRPMQAPME